MRVLPSSSREWISLALFPFKAFTVLAVVMLFIYGAVTPRGGAHRIGEFILPGYLLSGVVLVIGGVVQSYLGPRGAGLSSFLFAAAAFILLVLLAPMFVVA